MDKDNDNIVVISDGHEFLRDLFERRAQANQRLSEILEHARKQFEDDEWR